MPPLNIFSFCVTVIMNGFHDFMISKINFSLKCITTSSALQGVFTLEMFSQHLFVRTCNDAMSAFQRFIFNKLVFTLPVYMNLQVFFGLIG